MLNVVSQGESAGNPLDKCVPPESTTTTLEILGLPVRENGHFARTCTPATTSKTSRLDSLFPQKSFLWSQGIQICEFNL